MGNQASGRTPEWNTVGPFRNDRRENSGDAYFYLTMEGREEKGSRVIWTPSEVEF